MVVNWLSGAGEVTERDLQVLHAAANRHPELVEAALWAARELSGHHSGARAHRASANDLPSWNALASRFDITGEDADTDDDNSLVSESQEDRSKRSGVHRRRSDYDGLKRAASDNPYWSPLKTQKWGHRW